MPEKKPSKKEVKPSPHIKPIVKNPNPVLRSIAREVALKDISSKEIRDLLLNMKETLANTPDGVGIAAPQLGFPLQIFLVSEEAEEIDKAEKKRWKKEGENWERNQESTYEPREWKYYTFINPVIKNISKQRLEGPEGCLSVPGKYGTVRRFARVTMDAYDERGKKFTRGASNFFARVMQHEIDHLNGTLFIDKVDEWIEPDKK